MLLIVTPVIVSYCLLLLSPLGLSICKTNSSPNSGVSIMQIHPGSVADRIRKIKRGDELIQVIVLVIIK